MLGELLEHAAQSHHISLSQHHGAGASSGSGASTGSGGTTTVDYGAVGSGGGTICQRVQTICQSIATHVINEEVVRGEGGGIMEGHLEGEDGGVSGGERISQLLSPALHLGIHADDGTKQTTVTTVINPPPPSPPTPPRP